MINSDAHAPGEVAHEFDRAYAFAREAGYTHVMRFVGREAVAVAMG